MNIWETISNHSYTHGGGLHKALEDLEIMMRFAMGNQEKAAPYLERYESLIRQHGACTPQSISVLKAIASDENRAIIEDGNLLHLGNCTQTDHQAIFDESVMEDDDMAKNRIKRRVQINGVERWVTGNNEQEYANNLLIAIGAGIPQVQQPTAETHNFREYALKWFECSSKPNVESVTAIAYEQQLNTHILPVLGDMAVEDITIPDVQRVFNTMDESGKKTTETKKKTRTVLNMILQQAVEEDIIHKNPLKAKSVRVKGEPSKPTSTYTVEQMKYLVNHIDDVEKPMDRMYIAIHALHPLRPEEVWGLKWEDIDIESGAIHIHNTVTHPDRNQPVYKKKTKTDMSARTLALVPYAKQYLSLGKPDDFVFGGEKPLSYQQVRKMCQRIKKQTAFDESITPSRFRTTVLTDIYDQTKDVTLTSSSAGHTTPAMTFKHYVKGRGTQEMTAQAVTSVYGLQPAM